MGKRVSHAPGTFAWVDLRTTDPADAKRFYAELFGWTQRGCHLLPGPAGRTTIVRDPQGAMLGLLAADTFAG